MESFRRYSNHLYSRAYEMSILTDTKLVEQAMKETGLSENQVLFLVSRSALVRYLSENFPDRFWLKGGALLYHVYDSSRVSFKDTDLADISEHMVAVPELMQIFTVEGDGFYINGQNGSWTTDAEIMSGRLPFSISGFKSIREKDRMKISVSVRYSEVLDVQPKMIYDSKGLLYGIQKWEVNGLSLEEMAAEKVLGWCLKTNLYKHYADLAIIKRDHGQTLDSEKFQELLIKKVEIEKNSEESKPLYQALRVESTKDLSRLIRNDKKIKTARQAWNQAITLDVLFKKEERNRVDSFMAFENVDKIIQDFWEPLIKGSKEISL